MRIVIFCTLISGLVSLSEAAELIAPQSATGVEGNSYQIPLDTGGPQRFQQVYSSSLFSDFTQGILIDEIDFRGDAFVGHGFISTVSNIEIHLSTTSKAPDGLSPVFDDNVGMDDRIVVGRDPFLLRGAGGGRVVGPWSVYFYLDPNPFFYDPSRGNLLLDIKVFSGASTAPFDAVDITGDSVSSVFAYDRTLPSIGQPSSLGLATRFVFQPVPELIVFLQSTNLLFRWINRPSGFMLQQSPVLGLGATWQIASGMATTNGAYKKVTLPLDPQVAARFFRLVLPFSPSGTAGLPSNSEATDLSNQER